MERTSPYTAICLRGYALKEADKILVLFTREAGLKRVVAKGIRKPKSKIGGRLEPFRENEVLLARGRAMDVVTQVESLRAWRGPVLDLDLMAAAMSAAEVLLAFLEEEDPAPEAYDLYTDFLSALVPGVHAGLLLSAFELQLLELLGYRPELEVCMACDRELEMPEQVHGLHIEAGGAICTHCEGLTGGRVRRLGRGAWSLMTQLQFEPLAEAGSLEGDPRLFAHCRQALKEYVSFRAERELKAQRMFEWPSGVTNV